MKSDKNIFVLIGIITLVLIVGSVWVMSKTMNPVAETTVADEAILVRQDSPVLGEGAPVTLVEFSDFECPACAAAQPAIKQLLEAYPGKISLVYRHFPLETIHFKARMASYASEAAANQGKFWQMHDLLFEKQVEWSKAQDFDATLIGYAEQLGLDREKFEADLKSDEVKARINQSLTDGNIANIEATPTFFINNQKVTGFGSPVFNQLLQEALANSPDTESTAATDEAAVKTEEAL